MTSEAQLIANRRNALLSTGPNTPEGKEKSRKNGRKRRISGAIPLTLTENEAAFAAHLQGVEAAFAPQDTFETELVRQIALHQWRLARLQRIEAAMFDAETHRVGYKRRAYFDPSVLVQRRVEPADIWPGGIGELSRREAELERALARSMALLEQHRDARERARLAAEENSGSEANLSRDFNGGG